MAVELAPSAAGEPATLSDLPVKTVYAAEDAAGIDYARDLGDPGHYPFTRGLLASGYRTRLWTMRQFAGHQGPRETNKRFKYLLGHGETGLSTAFVLPTLLGIDGDVPRAEGEVGREGVAVSSLADFEILFDGIDLGGVSTSMTINLPAPVLLAMYLAMADRQGVPWQRLRGTLQLDILKEYIAQNEYLYPPEPSLRLVLDTIEFCVKEAPRFYPISISGYHIREAGASAVQELAFTLANGREYVRRLTARGLSPDAFARNLSFFFDVHNYFFEEIAKLRAARRLWARMMKEEFHAQKPTSWMLPVHCQTAGVSLTAQQPMNNLVRTAYQALAAVLGGTQSLHTNSYDEALALPTEEAVTLALRTQQILAHESGLTGTVDPFGGSYYLESLTCAMEQAALKIIGEIEGMGGVLAGLSSGYFDREISRTAYRHEQAVAARKRKVVGVNLYEGNGAKVRILRIPGSVERQQKARLKKLKASRDNARVRRGLENLARAARGPENILPAVLEAVRAYASLGEIVSCLQAVFGEYKLP
ncbi:MAG: methylmalonyl-CoA mutase [Elusimicrobia bacterium]|nr:methylmalonyl-CoA mutase [Elusimicrobiota bacterium]